MQNSFNLAFVSALALVLCTIATPAMTSDGINVIEQWNKTFGGTSDDYGYSVQQTADGGYIIAGCTHSYGAGDADIWLIKTDTNGNEQWNRTFGGPKADLLDRGSVRQTSDGGYILTGYTYSYGAGDADAWLIKTNPDGTEQWNRTFGGEALDWGHSVRQTADGGYIIAGRTDPYAGARADAWLIKTNSNGVEEWNRTFGTDACEYAASVNQTTDSGYIIAGRTTSYGAIGGADAWLIRTDSNGIEEWNRTFGGAGYDYGYSVQQTTDGGYVMAGSTNNRQDIWLIKTDADGMEEWNRTFGGPAMDEGYSVQQTADGGYIAAGYTASYGAGSGDVWVIKADPDGNEQWNKTFGGPELEKGYSVQQTADGGYIAAGYTNSYGAGGYDVWLIKSSTSAPKPDLVTTRITPLSFFPNQPNTITGMLANTGSADAGSFNVSLSIDGAIVDTAGVASLCAGSTVDVSFNWTPAVGNHELCVFADCHFAINESNEDNNELCEDVTVQVNTVYFMPISSTAVEVRVNTTDAIDHVLTDISFDPACINITEVDFGPDFTLADWVHKGDHITIDGFDFGPPCTQWSDRLLANLTVHCKNCCCISQLSFTGLENVTKLIECGGKASYGANWIDGSVRCEIPIIPEEVFDTGPGTYPSISGTHKGTITPKHDILVEQLYTYPFEGTGGHSEYAAFYYQNGTEIGKASWTGYSYAGDWHNITFEAPFTLEADETYNYTIKTGSYPQIIHKQKLGTGEGEITCLQFEDANGKIYYDWIPAIKLLGTVKENNFKQEFYFI